MATRRQSHSRRKKKLQNAFAAFDKYFENEGGDSHSPEDLGNHLDDMLIAQEESRRAALRRDLEMEAVLFYIEKGRLGFKDSICKYCGLGFSHTYLSVAYCSERCRAARLNELGIPYNLDAKPEHERWNAYGKGWLPKVIGPIAYEAIKKLENDCTEEENIHQSLPSHLEVDDENE